jgi:hypothetical protein
MKMLATSPLFTRHMVQPVPPREPVPVGLFAGNRRLAEDVSRPMEFGALT